MNILLTALAFGMAPDSTAAPSPGDLAPGFSLHYATRDSVASGTLSLSDLLSRGPVVIAFYPADWSPGCTKEVCTFRDEFQQMARLKAQVVGISGDQVYSHRAWARELILPFPLLSDMQHAVASAYGSYNEQSGFNRRTVFVVGTDGLIAYRDLDYSVRDDISFKRLAHAISTLSKGAHTRSLH